jgi:hypothetical protein
MRSRPSHELNKWQVIYHSGTPIQFMSDIFTRQVTFGIFKIIQEPVEGAHLSKPDYKGFMLTWYYWFPFKRGK